jgi:glutathione S-transferase
MLPRLVTIPISHYGERARWALDLAEIDYDERHHLQMFSWFAARRGGRKYLPILLTGTGEVLVDSADIVRWASGRARQPLYPEDSLLRSEIEAFEVEIAGSYGVETRRITYDWIFRCLDLSLPYNAGAAPAYQVTALSSLRLVVESVARSYLEVNPDAVARGRSLVRRTLDDVADRLRDGRPYLFGDRFSAADLTFSAMTAAATLPARYGIPLPSPETIPLQDARAWISEVREHPAGQYTLRLYDERPEPRSRMCRPLRVGFEARARASRPARDSGS